LKYSNKCLEANPEFTGAKINKASALLMMRQWEEGWVNYQASLGVSRSLRDYNVPEWNGQRGDSRCQWRARDRG